MVMWMLRLGYARKYIKMNLSLIKDCFVYVLLILQVVVEHTKNHGYIAQVIIVAVIMLMYRKYIRTIINVLLQKVKTKIGRK